MSAKKYAQKLQEEKKEEENHDKLWIALKR
jgi:hypothetical protein